MYKCRWMTTARDIESKDIFQVHPKDIVKLEKFTRADAIVVFEWGDETYRLAIKRNDFAKAFVKI